MCVLLCSSAERADICFQFSRVASLLLRIDFAIDKFVNLFILINKIQRSISLSKIPVALFPSDGINLHP
jgi:hypothetical protein